MPASLSASLTARLDRLGPAREAAQAGAVIGRAFPVVLLARVMDRPADALAGALKALTASGLLLRDKGPGGRHPDFSPRPDPGRRL